MPSPVWRCGPAGWSYPHWHGIFYPRPKPRGFHPLEYLARYYDMVEINTSFYRPPRPEVARLWMRQVEHNPAFAFTAKLNRRFTHERILEPGEVGAFKEGLWPLLTEGRLGCLLMQFPWSFRYTEENREYFIRLRRLFYEFPLAAEMRHSSWMHEEARGVFVDHHVAFCNIDQPPHMRAMPPTAYLTSPIAYVRLHGRQKAGWLSEFDQGAPASRCDYLYRAEELAEWKTRIERLRTNAATTFVVFNNDVGGKALVNSVQLRTMIDGSPQAAPRGLVRQYPLELAGLRPDQPVQPALFAEVA